MMGDTAAFTVTKENVEDDRALLQVGFFGGPIWFGAKLIMMVFNA